MITDSINYLRESDDATKTVAIGGLLTLFAFLVIPLFGVLGYVVRVVDRTARGDPEPPVFDDFDELFLDGLKVFVVGFVYSLVPAVVGGAVFAIGLFGSLGDSSALGPLVAIVGGLIWLVLSLSIAYVVPAAIASYADRRSVAAGFDVTSLLAAVTTREYAVGWLYAAGLVLAAGLVVGLLNGIPILGTIASAFVSFYALVAVYYVVGRTWGEMRPVSAHEEDVRGESPAI